MGVTKAALLDTSVVIALTREDRVLDLDPYDRVGVCALSHAELRLGVALARTPEAAVERYETLLQAQSRFGPGLPFDDAAAECYGRIIQTVVRRGGTPRSHLMDRMIAATAGSRGLPLLTLNAADLKGLSGEVEVVALAER